MMVEAEKLFVTNASFSQLSGFFSQNLVFIRIKFHPVISLPLLITAFPHFGANGVFIAWDITHEDIVKPSFFATHGTEVSLQVLVVNG
jgi:hypothetical protein